MSEDRFGEWKPPHIEDGVPTKWNWVVQGVAGLKLGFRTDIGAFTYINARHEVEIGDEVQIGSHCSVVMPGVTIGENSIVGAFSFVNKDIPPNVVAMGQPAKVVKEIV